MQLLCYSIFVQRFSYHGLFSVAEQNLKIDLPFANKVEGYKKKKKDIKALSAHNFHCLKSHCFVRKNMICREESSESNLTCDHIT